MTSRGVAPPPSARARPIAPVVVAALVGAAGLPALGFWIVHGDLAGVGTMSGVFRAVGHLTALVGTYLALLQLLLMSRSPWLHRTFGMDRLAAVHRRLGSATLSLLIGHAVFATLRLVIERDVSIGDQLWAMLTTYPFLPMAFASLGLFILVGVASMPAIRKRLSYETWLGLHLYAYLAVVLGFGHQLLASDFVGDDLARAYWIGLYVLVATLIAAFRVGQPIRTSLQHDLRVARIEVEAPGVVSIYMTGRDLARLPALAGQFLQWRFLTPDGWWRTHPFSLSAAPNGRWLRITVKALGDDTRAMDAIPVGTRVMVEGPYGALTADRRSRKRVLLVAAGIGITPMRALFEDLPADPGDVALIYRAGTLEELVHRDELDAIAVERGHDIHYIVGPRGIWPVPEDPFGPAEIARLVPDAADREVFVCGPIPMMRRVEEALQRLGIPARHVHTERFAF